MVDGFIGPICRFERIIDDSVFDCMLDTLTSDPLGSTYALIGWVSGGDATESLSISHRKTLWLMGPLPVDSYREPSPPSTGVRALGMMHPMRIADGLQLSGSPPPLTKHEVKSLHASCLVIYSQNEL